MNWSDHQATPRPLYGEQTRRALENFAIDEPTLAQTPSLVRAVALVKVACARVNQRLGALDASIAEAVVAAAHEVIEGRHLDQFPLAVVQGGGGTSTNMNVNEVLASRATQLLDERGVDVEVHPNNHVNRSQSTNDTMPTAIALAVHEQHLSARYGIDTLVDALEGKAEEYADLEHLGRSCLQDAVNLPVAEVHRSHAYGLRRAADNLAKTCEALLDVPLGGTAVGTGVGAPEGFAESAVAELAEVSGVPVRVSANPYWSLASLEPLVAVAEATDRCARTAARVATDLRLLASGPGGGIGEVELPEVQAGSSIMPGKVNPVIPELVMQASFQAAGEATSARQAATAGELEVSAMAPVVTLGVLVGLDRIGTVAQIFAQRCISGLRWNRERVEANARGALGDAVIAAVTDGYDAVAERRRSPARQDAAS